MYSEYWRYFVNVTDIFELPLTFNPVNRIWPSTREYPSEPAKHARACRRNDVSSTTKVQNDITLCWEPLGRVRLRIITLIRRVSNYSCFVRDIRLTGGSVSAWWFTHRRRLRTDDDELQQQPPPPPPPPNGLRGVCRLKKPIFVFSDDANATRRLRTDRGRRRLVHWYRRANRRTWR